MSVFAGWTCDVSLILRWWDITLGERAIVTCTLSHWCAGPIHLCPYTHVCVSWHHAFNVLNLHGLSVQVEKSFPVAPCSWWCNGWSWQCAGWTREVVSKNLLFNAWYQLCSRYGHRCGERSDGWGKACYFHCSKGSFLIFRDALMVRATSLHHLDEKTYIRTCFVYICQHGIVSEIYDNLILMLSSEETHFMCKTCIIMVVGSLWSFLPSDV